LLLLTCKVFSFGFSYISFFASPVDWRREARKGIAPPESSFEDDENEESTDSGEEDSGDSSDDGSDGDHTSEHKEDSPKVDIAG
jgi:hypothetical protein